MAYVLHLQIQLIFMMVLLSTKLRASVGEDPQQPYPVLLIERSDPVVHKRSAATKSILPVVQL